MDVSAANVADLVTFIAPGLAAVSAYRFVLPRRDAGDLLTTVIAVALSLPIVALARELWGTPAPKPLDLDWLAALLGGSIVVGWAAAIFRSTKVAAYVIGFFANPFAPATRTAEAETTVLALLFGRLKRETWVTVTLDDGGVIAGSARFWSDPLDDSQQIYLIHYRKWLTDESKWGRTHDEGGVLVDLSKVVSFEIDKNLDAT